MEFNIKANGWGMIDKVRGNRNGLMELYIKANGRIIKLRVKENLLTLISIRIKANGKMIKQMAMEFLFIQKPELATKDIGKMTCNMVLEFNCIVMEINIKECLNKEKEMVQVPIIIQLDKYIKDNGIMEKYKEQVFALGLMENNMMENG
jgi:hypothetical protein